jgi:late competence protein required for DNA uptake (superfamily II DNA/RNA helicase)
MRSSVYQLISDPSLEKMRNIIIRGEPTLKDPKFSNKEFLKKYSEILSQLSDEQKEAVANCMSAENYHLVSGAAKTGKTKVLASLIEVLRKTKLKVLVVSTKNEVIDELLVTLNERNVSFVRIANNSSNVHSLI